VALPWLSVIMPCHNGERWLAAALQSIVEQRDTGIEVILVDSSATEISLQIAARFRDDFALRSYRRLDLLPWTAKTNFGVAEARAEWICILHQDDLWLPNRCAALRQWLALHSDAVMHVHPAYIIDERGKKLGIWRCPLPGDAAPVPREILAERLLVQNFIAIPAPVIWREAFLRVGGMDDALWYTADWDLYLKLSATGDVWYHEQPLACFRIHKNSLTVSGSRNLTDFRKQHEFVRDRHADRLNMSRPDAMILRLAAASIDINTALAAANAGRPGEMVKALRSLLLLGPWGIPRYLSYSRIVERVIPRLRARLRGL
jgi:glycosyltransferase involved in cell wall biosynthesis